MINWTTEYIIAQILLIVVYTCICSTYFCKNRKSILTFDITAHIFHIGAFLLLNGLTGAAMCVIYLIRDIFFAIDEKNRKSSKLNKRDYIILAIFVAIIIVLTIFTYNGLGSLLSVIATLVSTVAIWQKETKYYKYLGIPVSIFWLGYNIYLRAIFAIVLETILFISVISGCVLEYRKNKK